MRASHLESKFATYWRALQGPELIPEHHVKEGRRWRFDFAHPATQTAVEIEGGQWSGGRHTRGSGYSKDCEKYNEAGFDGWTVFRLTGEMITVPNVERVIRYVRTRQLQIGT